MSYSLITQKRNDVPPTTCPLCSRKVREARYSCTSQENTHVYFCSHCSFLYLRPLILGDLDQRQLDSVDDAEFFHNSLLKRLHEKLIIRREIRSVRRIHGGSYEPTVLDIGCGTGWTSDVWKRCGFSVLGLEPSRERAEIARRRYGLDVVEGYLETAELDRQFDVVIMRHIIEHIADPVVALSKVGTILKPEGILLLVSPNIDCIGRFLFGTRWEWVLPYHCNFFSPASIGSLLRSAGFVASDLYQTPSPLWYPECFVKLFPNGEKVVGQLYRRLSMMMLLPFAPLVLAGCLSGYSDNLTVLAKKQA